MINRLQEMLNQKGVSQRTLARRVQLESPYVNRIIKENLDVRISTALKIAKALKTKIEKIWSEGNRDEKTIA